MQHEFAFYYRDLHPALARTHSSLLVISNEPLVHRIVRVLRFKEGDTCILFDRHSFVTATLVNYDKKAVRLTVQQSTPITPLQPVITVLLPLLKREALEEAVYQLTEVGVQTIQLVTTKKAHRHSLSSKEFERLEQQAIAAAEQSKNFYLPRILPIVPLADALRKSSENSMSIFFDMQGESVLPYCTAAAHDQNIVLLIGPEGDLAPEEKELVKESHFKICSLTPTVLRAPQAVMLAASLFRIV